MPRKVALGAPAAAWAWEMSPERLGDVADRDAEAEHVKRDDAGPRSGHGARVARAATAGNRPLARLTPLPTPSYIRPVFTSGR
jgi:hypothetical protein